MFMHLSLRLRIFMFFAFLAVGGSLLFIGAEIIGYRRLGDPDALPGFILTGVIGCMAIIGLSTWIWMLFDEHVARPVERLATEMRARAHADVESEIDSDTARYLGDLAPAAQAVARNLVETKNALAQAVGRETARLGLEKSRLEALLAEAADGVLFCTPEHTIALYNDRARDVLGAEDALGLNRRLARVLRTRPILQAYDRLKAGSPNDGTDLLVATRIGARVLEARMRLMWLEGQETAEPGYVLSLRDVSRTLSAEMERAHLLTDLLEGVEATLPDLPDSPARTRLEDLAVRIADEKRATDTLWWPMEVLPASDLGHALRVRLGARDIDLAVDLPQTTVRCDGYGITCLIDRLARSWAGAGATDLVLEAGTPSGVALPLMLSADGPEPAAETLAGWLETPLVPGFSRFAGRDVLIAHATRVQVEGEGNRTALRLDLPTEAEPRTRPAGAMHYDFDLLHAELPPELREGKLRHLSFVVFDTETTGLNPQTDEVCQIAAVRIVNGKVRERERFDMLVNPGRRIPSASTAVHHITDEMVEGAPGVADALTRFHNFVGRAVLIAHNAPFDMAFLRRRETEIGARWDMPILDTVLTSAILYGQTAEHTLDAVCDRLGVVIPEADRHTAIGDALGTAHAFARMVPMLEAAGLVTLGELIGEFDKHARLIEHLN